MIALDETLLEEKSSSYADTRLEKQNPQIASKSYRRSIKMSSPCFCGTDIEEAYEAGYREAWQDKHEEKPSKEYYGC